MQLKGIRNSYKEFASKLKKAPASEACLDALIEVEEAIKNLTQDRPGLTATHRRRNKIERILLKSATEESTGSIEDILAMMSTKIDQMLSTENLQDIAGHWQQLPVTILPTNPESHPIDTGSGEGFESREFQERLKPLLLALRENGIHPEDISMKVGTNTPEMIRESSYIVLWIPRVNRTVMVCNQLGEATFVFKGYISEADFTSKDKAQLVTELNGKRIIYNERSWTSDVLEFLMFEWEEKIPLKVNDKINLKRETFVRMSILKFFPVPENFMALNDDKVNKLKIEGKGLMSLSTQLGLPRLAPTSSLKERAIMARRIYGNNHMVIEREFWEADEWIEAIKKSLPTPDAFMSMTQTAGIKFKVHSKGLVALSKKIGLQSLNPHSSREDKARMAQKVYGLGHEVIECELWDKNKWIEAIKKDYPAPEDLMKLPSKDFFAFSVNGKGAVSVAGILGFKDLNPFAGLKRRAVMAKAIYGPDHDIIECELWDTNKWIEAIKKDYPAPEDLMQLNSEDTKAVQFHNKNLKILASKYFGLKDINPRNNLKDRAIFAKIIYGPGHKVIERELWDEKKWIEIIKEVLPKPKDLMNMSAIETENIRIQGKTLILIANRYLNFKNINPVKNLSDRARMAQKIYGKDHPIIEVELWNTKNWVKAIKKLFPSPESFMNLSKQEAYDFRIHGKGLVFMANQPLGCKHIEPRSNINHRAIMAQRIYGSGHDTIEQYLNEDA